MFILETGPQGRGIVIDASGRLIGTQDPVGGLFPYSFGKTGRALVVDASGRLIISPESDISGTAVSGIAGDGIAGRLARFEDANTLEESNLVESANVLRPISDSLMDLGAESQNFKIVYASSGVFASGVQIGAGTIHLDGSSIDGQSELNLGADLISNILQIDSGGVALLGPRPWIDVIAKGADPTGTADSATAFQLAHDDLPNQGGTIFIPPGTYRINSQLLFNKSSVAMIGAGPNATQINASGSFIRVDDNQAPDDNYVERYWFEGFSATDIDSSNLTGSGIWFSAYLRQQGTFKRLRLFGFGGGELIFEGGNNIEVANNYFSHNRVGSTGSALLIKRNGTIGNSPTTFTIHSNYFASTVSGANPMVWTNDLETATFIRNIYENVPSGVVGLRCEAATSGFNSSNLVFVGEHFEGISGTAWELHDVSNAGVFVARGARPTLSWDLVSSNDRYITEIGSAGQPDMTNLRRILLGLSGPNDFLPNASIQMAPIRDANDAILVMTTESDQTGRSGRLLFYGNDTGGTRREIGEISLTLNTQHASQPAGRLALQVATAGSAPIDRIRATGGGAIELIGSLATASLNSSGDAFRGDRNSGFFIGASNASGPLVFEAGGTTERARIHPNGLFQSRHYVKASGFASPLSVETFPNSGVFSLGSSSQFDVILTESVIVTSFTNVQPGGKYTFSLEQDSTGAHTVTWPDNVKWRGGTAPTLTVAASGIDVVTMLYRQRDDSFLADVGLNFS